MIAIMAHIAGKKPTFNGLGELWNLSFCLWWLLLVTDLRGPTAWRAKGMHERKGLASRAVKHVAYIMYCMYLYIMHLLASTLLRHISD